MSKRDIILSKLIQTLSSHNIQIHKKLLDDVKPLLLRSSYKDKAITLLSNRLRFLQDNGKSAVLHKEFEQIEQDMYSMHIVVPDLNLRILYTFLEDSTVLLYGFYEREGKRATDYTNPKNIARARIKELREGS